MVEELKWKTGLTRANRKVRELGLEVKSIIRYFVSGGKVYFQSGLTYITIALKDIKLYIKEVK
jgi:hypothetical protein